MQSILFVAKVCFLICVTMARFSHAGRVCSGDYLYLPVSLETREMGTLGIEGQFLTLVLFAGWIEVLIVLIVLVVQCCSPQGKYSPDKDRDM